jgi:hypothetical protein
MKIQEVILRAVAKKITWAQAGEIVALRERQIRRWKQRYEEFGYNGLSIIAWENPVPSACRWRPSTPLCPPGHFDRYRC